MFHFIRQNGNGLLVVICGPMFGGKSTELIHQLEQSLYAKEKVVAFKPEIDNRYSAQNIVTHSKLNIQCHVIKAPQEIHSLIGEATVIGIDEVQFFEDSLLDICLQLVNGGKLVFTAGLLLDYKNIPFETTKLLMLNHDYIISKSALCVECGAVASCTQYLGESTERVVIGGKGEYEARCKRCHTVPGTE